MCGAVYGCYAWLYTMCGAVFGCYAWLYTMCGAVYGCYAPSPSQASRLLLLEGWSLQQTRPAQAPAARAHVMPANPASVQTIASLAQGQSFQCPPGVVVGTKKMQRHDVSINR